MAISRIESLLESLLNGTEPTEKPKSRVEAYLYAIFKKVTSTKESLELADTVTSKKYKLRIEDGKLMMEEIV